MLLIHKECQDKDGGNKTTGRRLDSAPSF